MSYKPRPLEAIFGGDFYRLRKVMRVITSLLLGLVFVQNWGHALRDRLDRAIVIFNADKIKYFIDHYPEVRSERETIEAIVNNKYSIARYGDGEFNMCIGRKKSFQDQDERLVKKLKDTLHSNESGLLIGINTVTHQADLSLIWEKFVVRRGNRVLALLDENRVYESSTITTRFPKDDDAFEEHVLLLKQIWAGRKVLFVVGKGSRFFYTDELFDSIDSHDFLYGPPKNAFAQYDQILEGIRGYDKDWLIMISLGPTATVMAYDLHKDGYQVIDLGQTPSKFYRRKYGKLYPEGHHLA